MRTLHLTNPPWFVAPNAGENHRHTILQIANVCARNRIKTTIYTKPPPDELALVCCTKPAQEPNSTQYYKMPVYVQEIIYKQIKFGVSARRTRPGLLHQTRARTISTQHYKLTRNVQVRVQLYCLYYNATVFLKWESTVT